MTPFIVIQLAGKRGEDETVWGNTGPLQEPPPQDLRVSEEKK